MIYDQIIISVNGIEFDLELKDRVVLVDGLSGVGKTMLYNAIMQDAKIYTKPIICLDKNILILPTLSHAILETFQNSRNKLFVIDNADLLLTPELQEFISLDSNNQYIIFSHASKGYNLHNKSFSELKIQNGKGNLIYPFIKENK